MIKLVLLLSVFVTQLSYAEIWEKPPYKPDENHLPKGQIIYHKQAQEEAPREKKKKDEVKEEKFQKIDENRKENEESTQ